MKPEVMFLHRIKLYGAMLSLFLFSLGLWAPMADATVLKQADNETGTTSQYQQAEGSNRVDTFANFGIPALPGGGKYAASLHEVPGQADSDHMQLFYNAYALRNAWMRFYFFLPNSWDMPSSDSGNTLKFIYPLQVNDPNDDQAILYLWSKDSSGTNSLLNFYWQHFHLTGGTPCFTSGVGTGWSLVYSGLSRGVWHYIEINLDVDATNATSGTNGVVKIWLDRDARTTTPTWTNVTCGDTNYVRQSTAANHYNENWGGGTNHISEDWYLDGAAWGDAVIGDTYGLLGNQPPPDTTPPAAPSGLSVK